VGVAFYVMLALRQELRQRDWFNSQSIAEPNLAQMLDLVALGTVADLVPLDHLNRLLVKQGLKRINQGLTRPGIKTILQLARGETEEVVAQDMGFAVAPRLNAAGRLDDMTLGIECLLSQTAAGALPLAERLNDWNVERRQIQQTMENEASNIAQSQAISDSTYTISLYSDNWHEGVVGLVASKIKDHYYRPTVVFAPAEQAGLIKGSARSIKGIHIRDVLDAVATRAPDVLQKFGGHAMAAGLTIEAQHLKAFSALFETVVQEVAEPETFDNVLWTDGELPAIALNLDTAQLIRHYGPWGQKFPEPLFEGTFRVLDTYVLKQRHLKFRLQTSAGKVIDAIAFNLSDDILSRHFEQIHIAYRLNVNHFRGQSKAQLMIEHIVS
ncbi:MAG: DHHA1 domain-containing protein, partial [Gammaproteobacteria bacterium]